MSASDFGGPSPQKFWGTKNVVFIYAILRLFLQISPDWNKVSHVCQQLQQQAKLQAYISTLDAHIRTTFSHNVKTMRKGRFQFQGVKWSNIDFNFVISQPYTRCLVFLLQQNVVNRKAALHVYFGHNQRNQDQRFNQFNGRAAIRLGFAMHSSSVYFSGLKYPTNKLRLTLSGKCFPVNAQCCQVNTKQP